MERLKTKADWETAFRSLFVHGRLVLEIDGYDVEIQIVPKGFKPLYVLFVNNICDYRWADAPEDEITKRFYQRKEYYKYKKSSRDLAVKSLGVRKARKEGFFEKVTSVQIIYDSFAKIVKTVTENNTWIEKKGLTFFSARKSMKLEKDRIILTWGNDDE